MTQNLIAIQKLRLTKRLLFVQFIGTFVITFNKRRRLSSSTHTFTFPWTREQLLVFSNWHSFRVLFYFWTQGRHQGQCIPFCLCERIFFSIVKTRWEISVNLFAILIYARIKQRWLLGETRAMWLIWNGWRHYDTWGIWWCMMTFLYLLGSSPPPYVNHNAE